MTRARKPAAKTAVKSKGRLVGELRTAADIVALIRQIVTPEQFHQAADWLKEQHFSDRFIELTKQIHLSDRRDPLSTVENQCDAVEELIQTRSSLLDDDAPISSWRVELDKLRTGIKLVEKAQGNDTKKIKELEKRAAKLYNSVFIAVVGK